MIGTMSVSLSPCYILGQQPSFSLADDEMELGLGIHDEEGTDTIKFRYTWTWTCNYLNTMRLLFKPHISLNNK